MKKYHVKEIFPTLQGEGYHAGRSAIFVRFAGCNMWSGYERDRERDAERNRGGCPLWCDTDFTKEGAFTYNAPALVNKVFEVRSSERLIVFTGGEPLLQVDPELVREFRDRLPGTLLAVETNGTVSLQKFIEENEPLDWITCSPKVAQMDIKIEECHEIKLVLPDYRPENYPDLVRIARNHFLQIEDGPRFAEAREEALHMLRHSSTWRLSIQTHKALNLP
jgi:7-carboxy-7-deazaguanine synthase